MYAFQKKLCFFNCFENNLRARVIVSVFFGNLRSSKEMARIPKKIQKFESYPGSLSHYMRALTARSMTRSRRLHGKAIHMGARHLLLETASNQLLLQFAKH